MTCFKKLDNFKLEGCVKGNQVENADHLQSIVLVGKPGENVRVKKNPEGWMCKTWNRHTFKEPL